MKTDLGMWLGVDPDASNPNYTRLPEDVREYLIMQVRREIPLRRDLRFLEATDTITTASDDYDYTLPSDWGRPYLMWYKSSTTDRVVTLDNITRAEWQAKYDEDSSSNDIPEYYCIYGDKYLFSPTPDATYTIYSDYFKVPADFTADADYDDYLKHGWDAIFFGACARGCDYLMETTRRGFFEQRSRETLQALMGDLMRSRWSGRQLQSEEP
jgi:hypothetical protein